MQSKLNIKRFWKCNVESSIQNVLQYYSISTEKLDNIFVLKAKDPFQSEDVDKGKKDKGMKIICELYKYRF